MSTGTTVLVTGANRGIGFGVARQYLARPNYTVVAAVRDPSKTSELKALKTGTNSRLVIIQIDMSDNTQAAKAISQLKSEHSIQALDAVVANAGIAIFGPLETQKTEDFAAMLQVNVVAVLALYKATLPLLQKSSNPRFATIGSLGGSFEYVPGAAALSNGGYGSSKAAVHFLMRKLAYESHVLAEKAGNPPSYKKVTIFSIHPGVVDTDMGKTAIEALDLGAIGLKAVSADESAKGITDVMDAATFESANGKLLNYGDSAELPF